MAEGTERLVCVDPASTREYRIGGGVFRIGVLPRDIHGQVLELRKGRALDTLWLAARYGVKGHEGLSFEDGKPVPFNTEKDAKGREVVSEATLDVYRATGVLPEIASEVFMKGAGAGQKDVQARLATASLRRELAERVAVEETATP